MKLLFILYEPLSSPIVKSQVLLLAKDLKLKGIESEIWAFSGERKWHQDNIAQIPISTELSASRVRVFRCAFWPIPFSVLANAIILAFRLRQHRPCADLIHARADYAAAVAGSISRFVKLPVLWDCRGDSVAEMQQLIHRDSITGRLAKCGLVAFTALRNRLAGKTCTAANFVSRALHDTMRRLIADVPTAIIPCAVPAELFGYNAQQRAETRRELGYSTTDKVLLYSGGMATYQWFSEYVRLVHELMSKDPHVRFLVLTTDIERAVKQMKVLPLDRCSVKSVRIESINRYYCASDFGMLLREDNQVNRVASPTKFGEYSVAGLPVLMNKSVEQAWEFSCEFRNRIEWTGDGILPSLSVFKDEDRRKIGQLAKTRVSRESVIDSYVKLYHQLLDHFQSRT